MPSRQHTLSVIAVPAGERQVPGWFALHPSQFGTDAERRAAHGRWHCLSSANGRVYRALQFREDLPADGIALDWAARHLLEGGHAGAGLESTPLRLDIRAAHIVEYPRCLLGHPSPAARLGAQVAMVACLLCLAALLATLVVGLSTRVPSSGPQTPAVTDETKRPVVPLVSDTASFVTTLVGVWNGPGERLLIKNDKGVVEVLREVKLDDGRIRLDQYAAAPLRLDGEQRKLLLEMPDGIWQLVLIPGARRAQLSVTYPDKRNVLYQ